MNALDIIARALKKVGVLAAGETPNSSDAQDALIELNAMLDVWSARKMFCFANEFDVFTLVPGLLPHTIGLQKNTPTPTFTVTTQRPVFLQNVMLSLPGSPSNFDLPIQVRDDDWWANQRVKSLASNVPTDVYYSADWPNGSLYFWPVPNTAYGVRIEFLTPLSQIASITTPFSLPPGYQDAVCLSLAEKLGSLFQAPVTASLMAEASAARRSIQMNNNAAPRIMLTDAGMPDKSKPKADFNWMTGNL